MNLVKQYLGKVSITCNGKHDINKAYNRLCLVYIEDSENVRSYISKKPVPKNVSLANRDYWQPFGVVSGGGGGGIQEEVDPYAITDLTFAREKNEETEKYELVLYGTKSGVHGTFFGNATPEDLRIILGKEDLKDITDITTLDLGWTRDDDSVSLELEQDETHVLYSDDLPGATETYAGVMTAADKTKLNGIQEGATNFELCLEFKDDDAQGEDNDCTPDFLEFGNGLVGDLSVTPTSGDSRIERLTVNLGLLGDSPEYESDKIAFPIVDKYNGEEVCRINIDYASDVDGGLMHPQDKSKLDNLGDIKLTQNLNNRISNIGIVLTAVTSQTHFTIGSIYTDGTITLLSNAFAEKITSGLVKVTLAFNPNVALNNVPLVYEGFMYENSGGAFCFILKEASLVKGNVVTLEAMSVSDLVENGQLLLRGWY